MTFSKSLQMLTCLVLYASCVHAIMVKYGTKTGPIALPPPAPELAQPAQLSDRVPAPVWEERSYDKPDPNAQWRPQPVVPQPRFTQVAFNNNSPNLNNPQNAQQFVNSYIPVPKPLKAQPIHTYFTKNQILSSQSLPGFGIRYFVPAYLNDLVDRKNTFRLDDSHHNHIERNEIRDSNRLSKDKEQWKYEKEILRKHGVNNRPTPYQYKFPQYVKHQ